MSELHRFVVRLYDGFDGYWIDITEPVTKEEAEQVWAEKTGNGTHHIKYDDIDYYRIFPAESAMLHQSPWRE